MSRPRVVMIVGPTAVGKSTLALALALRTGGEIVSADSMMVYRGLDIGTAKPTPRDRARVAHHLIDILDPDRPMSAGLFRRRAEAAVHEIASRGKRPIVVGGTGLYLRALEGGLADRLRPDPEVRRRIEAELRREGAAALYARLRNLDPDSADAIHPNDAYRITRALEGTITAGRPISRIRREHGFREAPFEMLKIGLDRDRDEIYTAIGERTEVMIRSGLVDEVRGLLDQGYDPGLRCFQSIGYREALEHLRRPEACERTWLAETISKHTRHFARRQLTWFRPDKDIAWFHPVFGRARIFEVVQRFLAGGGGKKQLAG